MGIKILFIYPNTYGMNMLPPGVSLLSACLKREGHKVKLFDTTYYHKTTIIDATEFPIPKQKVLTDKFSGLDQYCAKKIGKNPAITVVAKAELAQSYNAQLKTLLFFTIFINNGGIGIRTLEGR